MRETDEALCLTEGRIVFKKQTINKNDEKNKKKKTA